ncbi:MAG TPA: cell wall hydrolase [Devosiaceae bacterium]|nr:cell wall hydrolase [Devosiaceae bacterium]
MSSLRYRLGSDRRARADYIAIRLMAGGLMAILSYVGLTQAALGPGNGEVLPPAPVLHVAEATISFKDGAPVISGSVGHLFEMAGTFVGPNEAMKTDRLRPTVDVLSLTRTFDEVRTRIASLANSNNAAAVPVAAATQKPDSTVAATAPPAPAPARPSVAVASIDPTTTGSIGETSALNAIDSASAPTLDPKIPVPATLSTQLAYAREDAPVTVFPAVPTTKYSAKDINCLAQAVYFEARSESYRGQVAVAQVVMNRLAHPLYPKTICGVVFQDSWRRNGCQFSFACDGIPEAVNEPGPWKQAEEIAQKVAAGELYLPEVGNATHYHATYVYPDWAPRLRRVTKIGMHIFYKFRNA